MFDFQLTRQLIAQITLVGMGLDLVGGCYLSYDLLGGRRGPLRAMGRVGSYTTLFFVGYLLVLGVRFAIVAALGMGILLVAEIWLAEANPDLPSEKRWVVNTFGFLRGVVLGLAGIPLAGPKFGAVFGLLSGIGLTAFYMLGFAPTDDLESIPKPGFTRHRLLATLTRMVAVTVAGLIASLASHPGGDWLRLGLRLGLAAGTVSALVGLFSPIVEWRIENLPERRLGVIGLGLIAVGMVLQSAQYWTVLFDIPVR